MVCTLAGRISNYTVHCAAVLEGAVSIACGAKVQGQSHPPREPELKNKAPPQGRSRILRMNLGNCVM